MKKTQKNCYPLSNSQKEKLAEMRETGAQIHHHFNDNVFSFGVSRITPLHRATGRELILSGEMELVSQNRHHNVWKAK